jgi:hypothetical protein
MKTQEINFGNKVIAEFIDYEYDEDLERFFVYDHLVAPDCDEELDIQESDWTSWLRPSEMKFNSSYDWLMPVVNKIQKLVEDPTDIDNIKNALWFNEIESLWLEVVNTIQDINNEEIGIQ